VSLALTTQAPPRPALLESILGFEQAVLDALPIGLYACGADGRILRVNRKAAELWGRTPRLDDPSQRFCGSFRVETLEGAFIPPDQTPMALSLETGRGFEGAEAVVINPDGRRWVARVDIQPLRDEEGTLIGAVNCFQDITAEHELRDRLARQQRTFDLAMVASKMGTWRYTMADNVCRYDDNAQRLYGLTGQDFLHDDAGVAEKFHPDDQALMWARVAEACDPAGDGLYEVDYRVKQLDGSWRWLSAWGLVEFEGEGPERRPVAIAGASRDLTERKGAEELHHLLINELNHRVKNSLATVQSIASQTLRGAGDMSTARDDIDARIGSLARAHDVLTARNWSGADLRQVIERALAPFEAARFELDGPPAEVSPRHVLALSMALHELATNAAKYGALTRPEGRVAIRWRAGAGELRLSWRERGGPPVTPPARSGFGTRLLQRGLLTELGGGARLDYAPGGVSCEIEARL
jgi:two-component sensor histidine kinase